MSSDEEISEEARKLLDTNFNRRSSDSDPELLDESRYGNIILEEYNRRYKIGFDLDNDFKEIKLVKGNDKKFWETLTDILIDEIPIWEAIRRNYEDRQKQSRGQKVRELEPVLDNSWKIKEEYTEDFKELLSELDRNYYNFTD